MIKKLYAEKCILILFLVSLFSNQALGIFDSRTALFNRVYSAGFTEMVEIPYSQGLGGPYSKAQVIDTEHPMHPYKIETIKPQRRPEFDYYKINNPQGTSYSFLSYQFDNFMICYVRARKTPRTTQPTHSSYQFCYIFPQPIDLVVQKLETQKNSSGETL